MLDPFDEIQFIHELSLRNFHQRSAGFNFSCPLCNEGKSPHKTRAWILLADSKHDHNTFMCHNHLPEGMSVRKFISLVDPRVFEKYKEYEKNKFIDDLKAGKSLKQKRQGSINNYSQQLTEKPQYIFNLNPKTFIPCEIVPAAVEYCKKRKIPDAQIKKLYYCPRSDLSYGKMIIFPLYFNDTEVFGFQGRSIKEKRFHNFMTNDSYKVYNLFNVDRTSNVYVFESIIDSYVMPNSIAMLGADLSKPVKALLKKPVFVFDNDRTGEEKTLKYLQNGEKCFIWPNALNSKDFGELAEMGIPNESLRSLIKSRIFSGLKGEVEIKIKLSKSKKTFRRQTNASI